MDSKRGSRRGGFTIVEVIIAMIVLSCGVVAMAGTTMLIVRQVTLANVMTQRSVALQSVIERLQATSFDNVGSGSDSSGVFRMSWSSTSETSQSKLVSVITTGPGVMTAAGASFPVLGASVADTFQYRVIRR
jgi:type II secretory pathway pseudopilin PulG